LSIPGILPVLGEGGRVKFRAAEIVEFFGRLGWEGGIWWLIELS